MPPARRTAWNSMLRRRSRKVKSLRSAATSFARPGADPTAGSEERASSRGWAFARGLVEAACPDEIKVAQGGSTMSSEHEHKSVHRRDVICGGGSAVLALMVATLLGGTRPVRAAGIAGAVPEVDGLAVRVVIDSYQFAVAPGRKSGSVDVQHFGWGSGGGKPPGRTLISEFGLSMHVESGAARRSRTR